MKLLQIVPLKGKRLLGDMVKKQADIGKADAAPFLVSGREGAPPRGGPMCDTRGQSSSKRGHRTQ